MHEVEGAVDRIDDPEMLGAGRRLAVFLAEDAVAEALAELLDDQALDRKVGLGREVERAFAGDAERRIRPPAQPHRQLAGLARHRLSRDEARRHVAVHHHHPATFCRVSAVS